jgi:hypothetical protein
MSADTNPGAGASEAEAAQDAWERLKAWVEEDPSTSRIEALIYEGRIIASSVTPTPWGNSNIVEERISYRHRKWREEDRKMSDSLSRDPGYSQAKRYIHALLPDLIAYQRMHPARWRVGRVDPELEARGTAGAKLAEIGYELRERRYRNAK